MFQWFRHRASQNKVCPSFCVHHIIIAIFFVSFDVSGSWDEIKALVYLEECPSLRQEAANGDTTILWIGPVFKLATLMIWSRKLETDGFEIWGNICSPKGLHDIVFGWMRPTQFLKNVSIYGINGTQSRKTESEVVPFRPVIESHMNRSGEIEDRR